MLIYRLLLSVKVQISAIFWQKDIGVGSISTENIYKCRCASGVVSDVFCGHFNTFFCHENVSPLEHTVTDVYSATFQPYRRGVFGSKKIEHHFK